MSTWPTKKKEEEKADTITVSVAYAIVGVGEPDCPTIGIGKPDCPTEEFLLGLRVGSVLHVQLFFSFSAVGQQLVNVLLKLLEVDVVIVVDVNKFNHRKK
jgi:hypothetical protein